MAVQVSHHAPSGRFIRAYLTTWGLLAAAGLIYLASLAWNPDLFPPVQQTTEPDPGLQAATKALAEIGTVRRTVTEMQGDIGRIRSTVEQQAVEGRASQTRLTALEERVTTLAAAPPAETIAQAAARADKRKAAAEPPRAAAARIISVPESLGAAPPSARPDEPAAAAEQPRAEAPKTKAPKIETGSIGPAITFGEPEVTPARQAFAVQLAAGPSLDALRLSWSLLRERHGGALATLQPRFVPPRAEGGPYRLLAGPFQSKAEADKACADIGVGRKGCFSTPYVGQPL
jgi:hypothetical protein